MLVWYVLFSGFQLSLGYLGRNNVCRNFSDYPAVAYSQNCWYNPDANSSPSLIAKRNGYPLEKYKVTTDDGYILALFRIPHNNTDPNSKRQPVLLQHGIGARAIFWMLMGENSLAFFLVNNGYDVWMPTVRGAGFSTQHKHLTMEDPSYWNFSFHEMATYDLPAITEFISNTTGEKGNIIYIGHSMGTTMSYIYSSVRKDHANTHLKALISLSPVAYLRTMTPLYKVLVPVFQTLLRSFINAGMYAIGHQQSLHQLIYKMCRLYPTIIACFMINSLGTGLSSEQVLPEMIPVFASYFPAAISMKTLHHFIQLIASGGRFQYYDYGFNNPIYYKSMLAPVYDVSNITLPVFLFIGRKDAIAVDSDVDILSQNLNVPAGKTTASKFYFNFAHNDFLLGRDLRYFHKQLLAVLMNKIGNT